MLLRLLQLRGFDGFLGFFVEVVDPGGFVLFLAVFFSKLVDDESFAPSHLNNSSGPIAVVR